jgi:hypothetical protein
MFSLIVVERWTIVVTGGAPSIYSSFYVVFNQYPADLGLRYGTFCGLNKRLDKKKGCVRSYFQ